MRILILGTTGMLGSALHQVFAPDARFETWGTMRDAAAKQFFAPETHARLVAGVDVLDLDALVSVIDRVKPDVLINAVGVIKQLATANDPLVVLPINSLLPHRLANLCGIAGIRLIHVSTDCVFSGRRGGYLESDESDAEDLYGKSKFIGEVHERNHVLTIRTSGIGHELSSRHGLLEWFLAAEGSVKGYRHAIYSGLPWVELARVIREYVLPNPGLRGLYHLTSDPIAKHDLLQMIATAYGKTITIVPDDAVRIDRSMDSSRFRSATGYQPAPWEALVAGMHAHHLATRPHA